MLFSRYLPIVAPIAMIVLGLTHETVLLVVAMFFLGLFTDLYRPAVNAGRDPSGAS